MRHKLLLCLALAISAPAFAKAVRVITPIEARVVNQLHVKSVEVVLGETAQQGMAAFETKPAAKRAAAGLAPFDAATPAPARPARDHYDTLPFTSMFALVMEDVTKEWGLTAGTPVTLKVTIDTLKTANAGMAMLGASADQLAGLVEVTDAATGAPLGSFYVDVLNGHSGLMGLAMRGSGVRESLSEEFGLQVSRQLTGQKSKRKAVKA